MVIIIKEGGAWALSGRPYPFILIPCSGINFISHNRPSTGPILLDLGLIDLPPRSRYNVKKVPDEL